MSTEPIIDAADLPLETPGAFDSVLGVNEANKGKRRYKATDLPVPAAAQAQIDALAGRVGVVETGQTAGHVGFATKALMDANLSYPEGTLALVTNDATAANNGTYRKTGAAGSGSWMLSFDRVTGLEGRVGTVESETDGYRAASDPVQPHGHDNFAIAFADEFGLVAAGIRGDGTLEAGSLAARSITAESVSADEVGTAAGGLSNEVPINYHFAIIDDDGRVVAGIKTSGALALNDIEVTRINGVQFASLLGGGSGAAQAERNYTAEINMVLSYGQSLSTGTDSTPPITLTQRFDNLRFAGGVRSQDGATPYTALVPLIETQLNTLGETPIAGATDMIKELVLAEDGLAYTDHRYQLLGAAPGAGGSPIANLVQGTGPYSRFVADVSNGHALALASGKTFKAQAMFWTQGESDYSSNTPAATYKTALIDLRNDLDAEVKAITGQAEPLVCISYQTQGHATYGHANDAYIAVAQLQVAKDNPHHYVACPLYWSQQSVHQSAQNSKRLGAYYGLCYKRVVVDGLDWKPVMPVAVNRQGAMALVRFNVPYGKLVFDTGFRAAQPGMGFTLVDSVGAALTISAVEIVGPDLVKITAATSIPAGAKLRYGYGSGGNLRDQQGDVIVFDGDGQNFPMHNWCVIFEEQL